jgi:hypothetical protein
LEHASPYFPKDKSGGWHPLMDNYYLAFIYSDGSIFSLFNRTVWAISLTHIFFDLNMLGTALFIYGDWWYADRRNLIYENVDIVTIKRTKLITLGFIFTALLALIFARWNVQYNETVYVLMLPLYYISHRIYSLK